ncbi:ribonuclease MRP protein subunit POP4 [Elaeis guineensis]|uniref:Uncharacterized protein LOC105045884 n=1 Tax=Elaeis guineensis var. tenera TaxID=51953 RepID=A0A6I9R8K1_ELAGV|nr:uncharacterized protein LOC105045884 [Elaeis guineensis]XP_010922616.1 uncharacterized protein LOC105045884 [Elaeis guineensis]
MASQTTTPPAALSEGRKRALAALDRRFAIEAELLQEREQRHESKKRKRAPEGERESERREGEDIASLASAVAPNPSSSSKQGNLVTGRTPRRETDGDAHPVYSELSEMVHESLLQGVSKTTNRGDSLNKVINDIIQKGDEGIKYAKGTRSLKFDNWILLDNFVSKSNQRMDTRAKALQSHSKRSRKHMSMRQHRKCGTFDLPKEFYNFDLFKPMHEMWKSYIIELLKETGKKELAECLLMADLHGAFFLVVECKTTAFKGVSGIMIRETAETFGIITQNNRFRVVPKMGSVFIFQAGCWKITLYGDKFSKKMLEDNKSLKHRKTF